MVRRRPDPVLVPAFMLAAVLTAFGPGDSRRRLAQSDESFFAEKVYPVLHAAPVRAVPQRQWRGLRDAARIPRARRGP